MTIIIMDVHRDTATKTFNAKLLKIVNTGNKLTNKRRLSQNADR